MVKFLADQNLNEAIVTALLRRYPGLDMVLARTVGLAEAEDPEVLRFAAEEGRVVLTHDKKTMPEFAAERIRGGEPMPGLLLVKSNAPLAAIVDDLCLIVESTDRAEWGNRIEFLPL